MKQVRRLGKLHRDAEQGGLLERSRRQMCRDSWPGLLVAFQFLQPDLGEALHVPAWGPARHPSGLLIELSFCLNHLCNLQTSKHKY